MKEASTKSTDSQVSWSVNRKVAILFILLLIVLVACNIALLYSNQSLKTSPLESRALKTLKSGDMLPILRGLDISGSEITVEYGNKPVKSVLLFFSPYCGWCKKNLANWKTMVEKMDKNYYRFFAISSTKVGLKEYIANNEFINDISVIAELEPSSKTAYKLSTTPQTILIGSDGRVEKIWEGALQDQLQADCEKSLGIKLPGATQ